MSASTRVDTEEIPASLTRVPPASRFPGLQFALVERVNKGSDLRNRTLSPEINPRIDSPLIFDKGTKVIWRRKYSLFNGQRCVSKHPRAGGPGWRLPQAVHESEPRRNKPERQSRRRTASFHAHCHSSCGGGFLLEGKRARKELPSENRSALSR